MNTRRNRSNTSYDADDTEIDDFIEDYLSRFVVLLMSPSDWDEMGNGISLTGDCAKCTNRIHVVDDLNRTLDGVDHSAFECNHSFRVLETSAWSSEMREIAFSRPLVLLDTDIEMKPYRHRTKKVTGRRGMINTLLYNWIHE